MAFAVAKHAVGVIILLLAVVLLLTPVPLSNVAPATVISVISVAYLEEDGLLLSAAFLAAIILIARSVKPEPSLWILAAATSVISDYSGNYRIDTHRCSPRAANPQQERECSASVPCTDQTRR
jgi:hypothetical protein